MRKPRTEAPLKGEPLKGEPLKGKLLKSRLSYTAEGQATQGQAAEGQAEKVDPKNRMNDLGSQRWLTFQKSWFTLSLDERTTKTATEFIEFFTKRRNALNQPSRIGLLSENSSVLAPLVERLGREAIIVEALHSATSQRVTLNYALVDLCDLIRNEADYDQFSKGLIERLRILADHLEPQAYLSVFIRNADSGGRLAPIAWQLGKELSRFMAIKDEKIGCEIVSGQNGRFDQDLIRKDESVPVALSTHQPPVWRTVQNCFYALNFRKNEEAIQTLPVQNILPANSFALSAVAPMPTQIGERLGQRSSWFIPRPPAREKNVLLHPAKFPEPLVKMFLNEFTQEGERIFDPMAGTGSTLLSALSCRREAYGIELNPHFHQIAVGRIQQNQPSLAGLFELPQWQLKCGDSADAQSYASLPQLFDYVLTSPPYWDMLRMKGAETQENRKKAGLLQYYSEDSRDLGNVADYDAFLGGLVEIYRRVAGHLAPGRFMTIIVKNVKKKGAIYTLAWDLALRLSDFLTLCHEQFWCQNDINLAPFGYRYAWVSNTVHHYCLHFQKNPND